jgi:ribosomal protein S27AE
VNVLDGNAMAGDLRDIFAIDVTAARFMCAGCGHTNVVATLLLYGQAPGQVARCPECSDVVMRFVHADDRIFLDMRGTVRLELPMSGS